jgi:quercetin dioxygenase-like cupin family protein
MMSAIDVRRFGTPDEKRPFVDKGFVEVLSFAAGTVGRAVFEPGWQWSKHVQPIAGTKSCQAAHAAFVVAGRMRIVSDDGQTVDVGPGDVVFINPGHDAWVLGDEPCIMLDFAGAADYARPRAEAAHPSP